MNHQNKTYTVANRTYKVVKRVSGYGNGGRYQVDETIKVLTDFVGEDESPFPTVSRNLTCGELNSIAFVSELFKQIPAADEAV